MDCQVLSTNLLEPVTVADQKAFMGYPSTDQDAIIYRMIQTARNWLEIRTGLSLVSKSYKVYFDKGDAVNGWYELPYSPVLSTPAITVSVCGVSDASFETKGLTKKWIRPSSVIGTISMTGSVSAYYLEVTFQAGATNETANEILKRIVSSMFNAREDGGGAEVLTGRIPYDTIRLIEMIEQNTGF